MQIVIDIPDDVYRVLKDDIYPIPDAERLAILFKVLVKKETPLLKGNWINDADKIDAQFGKHTYNEISDFLAEMAETDLFTNAMIHPAKNIKLEMEMINDDNNNYTINALLTHHC